MLLGSYWLSHDACQLQPDCPADVQVRPYSAIVACATIIATSYVFVKADVHTWLHVLVTKSREVWIEPPPHDLIHNSSPSLSQVACTCYSEQVQNLPL